MSLSLSLYLARSDSLARIMISPREAMGFRPPVCVCARTRRANSNNKTFTGNESYSLIVVVVAVPREAPSE
ncbi:Hypothetical predicted protein [Olea europaea subsp. europaea]|uniref:Uncharacterized protein n=1 Tax=Olea europaea subsp. europaea TaxID=158383 RepID=A0A8S0TL14_OLEEU|nr:Hypothetical predicted protein [Olea europaea subsp. europaea]